MKRASIVAAAALLLAGCGKVNVPGKDTSDPVTESQSIPVKDATSAKIQIEMGAGEIQLGHGAAGILDAEFIYKPRSLKPVVNSSVASGRAYINLRQPSIIQGLSGDNQTQWNLKLNDKIPTELHVNIGAGKSVLNLAGVPVTRLDIQVGAGELQLDLSGPRTADLDAHVEGGVGGITIKVPSDTGVRVKADQGIGELRADRFKRRGAYMVNDAYGKTPIDIRIEVTGGIGSIKIIE